jgi:tRNA(Ile)-lysidine synthase
MLDRLTIERMGAAARDDPILIAFSGGGDSTALLLLLAERFGVSRVRAGIVDHAMRAGSADDAKRARDFAKSLGVRTDILTVAWGAGQNRSQQSARDARYGVLCGFARQHGAHVIALGHTADDQAETVLMRAGAGSAWRGLAGIAPFAPAPIWPEGRGIMLGRPLLGSRRATLRSTLDEKGVSWIDDPANENPAYERVRIRTRLAELERVGFDVSALVRLARRMRAIADRVDAAAAALIDGAAHVEADTISVDLRAWQGDATVRQRALSVLIAAASGEPREPAPDAVERLDDRMRAPEFRGATLGGAVFSVRRGRIVLSRDSGALSGRADGAEPAPPVPLPPGEEIVWDGRLALTASAQGAVVYAVGSQPRIETTNSATVATQWLLTSRVAHMLGAAAHDPNSETPQNGINISKP